MIRRYDLKLTDEPDKDGFWPFMSACILSGDEGETLRPAVVLCPGGGYECSGRASCTSTPGAGTVFS